MRTQFAIHDVKKLIVEKQKAEDKGITYDYSLVLEMFPDSVVPIDFTEYNRLSRAFSRNMKRGTLIEA